MRVDDRSCRVLFVFFPAFFSSSFKTDRPVGSRWRFRRKHRGHVRHRRAQGASRLQAAIAVQRRGLVQAVDRRRVLVVRHADLPQLGPTSQPGRADGHRPGNRTVPWSVRRLRTISTRLSSFRLFLLLLFPFLPLLLLLLFFLLLSLSPPYYFFLTAPVLLCPKFSVS